MTFYFIYQTPVGPLPILVNWLSSGYQKFNQEPSMIEPKIVRGFNWVNEDLLEENPKVVGMSLYLNDTKEVDELRRLLGQASQPRLDTWELLIDTHLG